MSLWPEACGQQPQRVELSGPGGQELLCSPAPTVWPNPVVSSRRGRWLRQGLRGASAYGPRSSPRAEPGGGKILPRGHSQENTPSNGAPRGTAGCREGSTSPRGAPGQPCPPAHSVRLAAALQPCPALGGLTPRRARPLPTREPGTQAEAAPSMLLSCSGVPFQSRLGRGRASGPRETSAHLAGSLLRWEGAVRAPVPATQTLLLSAGASWPRTPCPLSCC